MIRLLPLLLLTLLAACATGTYASADADASSADTAPADATADDPPPPIRIAVPVQPTFVAPSPQSPLLELANLKQKQPTAVVKAALDAAVQGLLYTSESDYPFQVFVVPGGGAPHATAYNIKQKVAPFYVQRPDTLPLAKRAVQSRTLASLLKNYVVPQDWWSDFEQARAPQFQKLKKLITSQLSYVHVYRVGPKTPWGLSPDIDVFIVGTTATGDLLVLWTVAIET